ncbi:MAG: DUF2240 family protein [archaeon]|nr:MAG: DUF2240 family protein [archaeon]
MYGSLGEIVSRIVENTDLEKTKVENMIKEKESEFSGLISPEGAAHIIAKELGLNLLQRMPKDLKVENILSGMNTVNMTGKVLRIFEPREFEKNGKKGKVVNLILADETGQIRMSLWNEQVKAVEEGQLEQGKVIEIINGYTKDDGMGGCELRLGRSGQLKLSDKDIKVQSGAVHSMKIRDLSPGANAEVRGAMVQFFESNPFYYVCPKCENRVTEGKCEEHGEVKPKPVLVISGIIDDGYGNIRVVFFREQAEKVLGMDTKKAYKITEEGKDLKPLRENLEERLGLEFRLRGRAKVNKFFERLELVANQIEEIDPEKEAKAILNNLKEKN